MILNTIVGLALVVALLAVVTAIGTAMIERQYPPEGRFVDVTGGRLHVLALGTANDEPPVVLLHGASGNLQDMRLILGNRFCACFSGARRRACLARAGHAPLAGRDRLVLQLGFDAGGRTLVRADDR